MKIYLILPLVAVLTACQFGDPPAPAPDAFVPRCGQDRLRGLVGQDAAVLREVDLPPATRVVKPDMAVTQDYRPDRLNISITKDGLIDRVWCS
ncbi:I78 family peptidase inhibitor [uncultured Aliiroseovarius sp.]|uniref:I78 family peptidase inhibitor n=1 Tax=uncultured Aliiroseovarius sp. TaxID=1658783 RepID=UPI002597EC60|nr:I78 family peptidase inhibitor [uncultured Aliiroseovarius sp.]